MSLTSFESYFGNVFNAKMPNSSNPKKRKRAANKAQSNVTSTKSKKSKSNTANTSKTVSESHHSDHDDVSMKQDATPTSQQRDANTLSPSISDFASNQKGGKSKLGDITLSSFKMAQIKKHRKNSANSEKCQLQSNLISLGFKPGNMSLMKQRKLLEKAMKKLSKKEGEEGDSDRAEHAKTANTERDPLAFMQDNDLFADDKNAKTKQSQSRQTSNSKNKNQSQKKAAMKAKKAAAMDLEFGDVIKPDVDLKQQIEEERFIRTGKANKPISDRKLLRELKKRDKFIQRRFGEKRVFVDDLLASNAMRKIRGEKVKKDLNVLKAKLKKKHKSKLKSQKKWRERTKRREYGKNKKLDRRDANVAAYKQKKVGKRMKNRITTEHALAVANEMM